MVEGVTSMPCRHTRELGMEIRELVRVPESVERLVSLATWDLWYGPLGPVDDAGRRWPGFVGATDAIRAWAERRVPHTITEDVFAGGYFVGEPEGYEDEEAGEWVEPEWQDYRVHEGADALALVLGLTGRTGRELVPYLL